MFTYLKDSIDVEHKTWSQSYVRSKGALMSQIY